MKSGRNKRRDDKVIWDQIGEELSRMEPDDFLRLVNEESNSDWAKTLAGAKIAPVYEGFLVTADELAPHDEEENSLDFGIQVTIPAHASFLTHYQEMLTAYYGNGSNVEPDTEGTRSFSIAPEEDDGSESKAA